jgi:hypothetical protein
VRANNGSITSQSTPNPPRQVSQTNTAEIANKSAYATVAPGVTKIRAFQPAAKFRVPFDEGSESFDPVVQVDSLAELAAGKKCRGDELLKILALGDMRI